MLEEKEIERLRKFCKSILQDNFDKFDFEKEGFDKTLKYEENRNLLLEKLNQKFPRTIEYSVGSLKTQEHQQQEHQKEVIEKIELQAEKEFEKSLEEIEKTKTNKVIEDIFFVVKQFTKMVAKKSVRGFLLYGETSIGKTFSVKRAFIELGVPFIILSGHISSLELYNFLFEHKKEHIILDDVNILENEQNLNLIKACLSEHNGGLVQYHTTSPKLRVPNKFVFGGTLTIILNELPRKCENLKAVESRILNYELKIDYKTKIKLLYALANQKYKDLTKEERKEIVKWIKENTSEATENLNLRILFILYETYIFNKEIWKKLAKRIIKENEEIRWIIEGMGEKEWCEKTNKHRATYYRNKQKLGCRKVACF